MILDRGTPLSGPLLFSGAIYGERVHKTISARLLLGLWPANYPKWLLAPFVCCPDLAENGWIYL